VPASEGCKRAAAFWEDSGYCYDAPWWFDFVGGIPSTFTGSGSRAQGPEVNLVFCRTVTEYRPGSGELECRGNVPMAD